MAHGTHLRAVLESYLMNTNMTGFRWYSHIFASLLEFWMKVALALGGLIGIKPSKLTIQLKYATLSECNTLFD